ncbi:MAG: RluA family pseudouridine synthase [Actinomycetota bacterium]
MDEPETLSELIPAALDGERIDRVVALVADVSRREAVDLIGGGKVGLDGAVPEKPSVRVRADSVLTVEVPAPAPGLAGDPTVDVTIVHQDDQVVVVDKPADLVVHPGSGVRDATLVHGLLARFPELLDVGDPERPGIVHRLDRGTSGLLMVARTVEAYEDLVDQLAVRTVSRVYRTLVSGLVASDSGLIDAPLGRSPRDATRRAVVAGGRPARTRYEVVARYHAAGLTQLECRLETGRTHQIRAHLGAIDHPVVGDERYGGQSHPGLARPFLHAATLEFDHPTSGERLRFDAALPSDLIAVLDQLSGAEAVAAAEADETGP